MNSNLQKKLNQLTKKKKQLDSKRPLPPEQVLNIQEWMDVEYTYTSNAIEGSTLNRSETALVIEKGITVKGKKLREYLEATNHIKAIDFIRSMINKGHQFITEKDIKAIHKIILTGINDEWAGKYRLIDVFIRGADVEPPSPNQVPHKMKMLAQWLEGLQTHHPILVAADLHFKFVAIHPFIDGNGRTARLLMNLVLMQHGYPLTIIKTKEREDYINSINQGTVTNNLDNFYTIIFTAVERSLDAYLAASKGKSIIPFFIDKKRQSINDKNLLQIGEVATLANVPIPTIRYYITQKLIKFSDKSPGGFMLFDPKVVETIKQIKRLQKQKRLTIEEIKQTIRN